MLPAQTRPQDARASPRLAFREDASHPAAPRGSSRTQALRGLPPPLEPQVRTERGEGRSQLAGRPGSAHPGWRAGPSLGKLASASQREGGLPGDPKVPPPAAPPSPDIHRRVRRQDSAGHPVCHPRGSGLPPTPGRSRGAGPSPSQGQEASARKSPHRPSYLLSLITFYEGLAVAFRSAQEPAARSSSDAILLTQARPRQVKQQPPPTPGGTERPSCSRCAGAAPRLIKSSSHARPTCL